MEKQQQSEEQVSTKTAQNTPTDGCTGNENEVDSSDVGSTTKTNQQGPPVTPTCGTMGAERKTPPVLLTYTPNGSEEWIRRVELEFTPKVGQQFQTLDEGIKFYRIYGLACGFDTRLYTAKTYRDGTIRTKCVVCNREGFRERKKNINSITEEAEQEVTQTAAEQPLKRKRQKPIITRTTRITRIGCKAMIKFRHENGIYVVDVFYEAHNHNLCSIKNREFQKLSRNLSLYHKQTILNHSKVNIGATKSYRICKEYANGYENVGASLIDFKNFQRDIKCFIGGKDAEMFINNFEKLAETKQGFYFAYELDDGQNLCRVFWTDAVARKNYAVFGDVITYDPTYGTNKYCMVFTPFTGIDNHKKSVTFGGALLSNEDEVSFKWTFEKFLDAMGKKEPQIILTDQDPAIKNAVPAVFQSARHRFCMWHIMDKVVDKVGTTVCKESDFLTKLGEVVWNNDLEPLEFEEKWCKLMEEFDLEDHRWLSHMYSIRENWIPAYHRDLQMGCILRTTQRSESENSFFKRFENQFGTLVEFWLRFQSAMDQQRHTQKQLDMENDSSLPQTISPLDLELHASKVYTHKLFYDFQEEMKYSLCTCGVAGYMKTGSREVTSVEDAIRGKTYEVKFDAETCDAKCSCKLFERKGYLCRHVLWVYSGKRLKQIPEKYIAARWTKKALMKPLYDVDGNILDDYDVTDVRKIEMSNVWTEFYGIVGILAGEKENHVKELIEILRQFKHKLNPETKTLTKEKELEMLLGCTNPKQVTILPPNQSKNKGSGKRLVSTKTQSIAKAQKPKRLCNNCKQMANHDKRNCPLPYVENPPEDEVQQDTSEDE